MKGLIMLFGFGMIALLSIHTNTQRKEKKQVVNEPLILVADIPQETKLPTPFLGKKVD